ncbi:helix-turn-helix domain-containing protein [Ancylobacter moscoviensis]
MVVPINRARLKSERLGRGWSQDQLASISGVSVRTIQRLEGGRAATPTSLAALAIAMSLPETVLAVPDGPVRRVTPLTVVEEIDDARRLYESLGFAVIATGDPGCIGVRAGNSYLILCTGDFLRGEYATAELDPLVGQTIPYLWVRSLDVAAASYANVIEKVTTQRGTREALVEHRGQWAILAETVP